MASVSNLLMDQCYPAPLFLYVPAFTDWFVKNRISLPTHGFVSRYVRFDHAGKLLLFPPEFFLKSLQKLRVMYDCSITHRKKFFDTDIDTCFCAFVLKPHIMHFNTDGTEIFPCGIFLYRGMFYDSSGQPYAFGFDNPEFRKPHMSAVDNSDVIADLFSTVALKTVALLFKNRVFGVAAEEVIKPLKQIPERLLKSGGIRVIQPCGFRITLKLRKCRAASLYVTVFPSDL